MRKVIIIDNNRIGLFDLGTMTEINHRSEIDGRLIYDLKIRADEVLESKTLVKRIEKQIRRRRKYEGK